MSGFVPFIEVYEARVDEISRKFRKLIEESNKLYKVLTISEQIQLKQPDALKDLLRKAHREQTEYQVRVTKLNDLLARAREQTLEVSIEVLLEEIQQQLDESHKYHDRDKPAHYRKVLSKIRTSLANLPVENTPDVQKHIDEISRQLIEIADYIYKKRGISMLSKIKSFKLEQEEGPVFLELEQHLAQIEAKERPSRTTETAMSSDVSAIDEQDVFVGTVALGKQTGTTMKDFFVSYNGNDRRWAEWIAWSLEKEGYTTVIQAWDFRAGGDFVMEMQKAATGTRKTIAVLSDDYLRAEYTQPEWGNAFARDPQGHQRTLIPVRVEPCKPDGLLATRIYVDLVGLSADEAREKLMEELKDRGKPASSPPFPGSGRQPPAAPANVSAPPRSFPGSASGAVDVWREKLEFLRMQEPLIVAADQKFALKKQIEEAERKIRELGG